MKVGDRVKLDGVIVGVHYEAAESFTDTIDAEPTIKPHIDPTRIDLLVTRVETEFREVWLLWVTGKQAAVEVDLR